MQALRASCDWPHKAPAEAASGTASALRGDKRTAQLSRGAALNAIPCLWLNPTLKFETIVQLLAFRAALGGQAVMVKTIVSRQVL